MFFDDVTCKASATCKTSSECKGYLDQRLAQAQKAKKTNESEKISYIFPKKFSPYFMMTADQVVK